MNTQLVCIFHESMNINIQNLRTKLTPRWNLSYSTRPNHLKIVVSGFCYFLAVWRLGYHQGCICKKFPIASQRPKNILWIVAVLYDIFPWKNIFLFPPPLPRRRTANCSRMSSLTFNSNVTKYLHSVTVSTVQYSRINIYRSRILRKGADVTFSVFTSSIITIYNN